MLDYDSLPNFRRPTEDATDSFFLRHSASVMAVTVLKKDLTLSGSPK
jgi:hypothetical protein